MSGLCMNTFQKQITHNYHEPTITSIANAFLTMFSYDLDCNTKKDDKYTCTSNCTSVWFKYLDEKSNSKLAEQCGTHFYKKYRNVM